MGRQVSFYATLDDEHELLAKAQALGCQNMPNPWRRGAGESLDTSVAALEDRGYIVPPGVAIADVRLDWPVVEIVRSQIVGKPSAWAGRVYLGTTNRGHPSFDAASKVYTALSRIVRGWPRLDEPGTFYVGPDALEKARLGLLPLVPTNVR